MKIMKLTIFLLAGRLLWAEPGGYYEYGTALRRELPVELLNPAFLARFSRPEIYLGMGVRILQEERTTLVFDQFENTMGEAVYADNTTTSVRLSSLAGVFPFGKLGLGVKLTTERDFNYLYQKEYRDDFYVKVGEDRFQQQGFLYSGRISAGFMPVSLVSVGIGGQYLFGNRTQEQMIIRIPDTSSFQSVARLRGVGWCAGAGIFPSRRLQLGLSYQSGVKLIAQDGERMMTYPWVSELTAQFWAPGALPAKGYLSLGLTGWSGARSDFKNVISVAIGVEHLFLNLVQLDYGFGLEPLPNNPTVHRFIGLLGVGFDVNNYRFNIKTALTRMELHADSSMVPFAGDGARVYQNGVDLGLTIQYRF